MDAPTGALRAGCHSNKQIPLASYERQRKKYPPDTRASRRTATKYLLHQRLRSMRVTIYRYFWICNERYNCSVQASILASMELQIISHADHVRIAKKKFCIVLVRLLSKSSRYVSMNRFFLYSKISNEQWQLVENTNLPTTSVLLARVQDANWSPRRLRRTTIKRCARSSTIWATANKNEFYENFISTVITKVKLIRYLC